MDEIEYLGATSTLLSYNLFTYCEGNPVNRKDNNGSSWFSVIGAIIGAAIGTISLATKKYTYKASGVLKTAIETEGTIGQKIGLGFTIGANTAAATFVGSLIPAYSSSDGLFYNAFTNYSSALMTGTLFEVGNVAIQQKIMHNAESVMVSNVKPSNLIKASNFSYALM